MQLIYGVYVWDYVCGNDTERWTMRLFSEVVQLFVYQLLNQLKILFFIK